MFNKSSTCYHGVDNHLGTDIFDEYKSLICGTIASDKYEQLNNIPLIRGTESCTRAEREFTADRNYASKNEKKNY